MSLLENMIAYINRGIVWGILVHDPLFGFENIFLITYLPLSSS